MLTFKKYKFFFKIITTIFQISIFSLITSCTLKKNDILFNNETNNSQLKKLIIPKGINIPSENQEYHIPYTQEDLNKKNHDIFPPI
ncbi:hypothetical protein D9V76_00495 [Buchnera aphidicola (Rhopalosiphum padi)]|uniref:Outer membrane protein assembly factor BamC n=1 Tax=Buchnera aphidicola subsp. Rhopalosiphum padi TaxID=98793 RepID=A0A4D6Y5T8_BUCRP|nr:hypothetical protein [Buchnera aphidicola]QCI24752.1 hypothetical protein D9V76_00495 [Buchnera aphidicola (Rhopalosiphum padi)]